ncbi:glutathione synthetase [Heyndrickxia ginsengihumi]|uniref:Glutathione synthetase n=1 Tax=Heyndrickxia ginsengihumi TaxID=363870 RepID=A0A0A6VDF8_9BACI|nr:YheC/YheD family protein [Heyndrickxia ginsengihumi]KHD84574.1 glutathione synthetase [Heyndrickxia ginsengihumi]MBE6184866.1 YheC/YheD family protein [Bacillus sp. (in: firmicutes)]
MAKKYKIDFFDEESHILYYPASLSLSDSIKKIGFGSTIVEVKAEPHPNESNVLSISKGLANSLYMPTFIKSIYLFQHEQLMILGPLVGIFSSGFTPYQVHPIGERSNTFARLLSVQSSIGVVPFLFGEQHIDWDSGLIAGFFYQNGKWEKINIPFPNVIYDRLPNRKSEMQHQSRKVKEKLEKEYLIPWYNPGFFNKLEVHERLFQDEKIEKYLPETHLLTSNHQIEQMLATYGHVYIKPINGSLGIGVHQIIYDRNTNAYYCRYHDGKNHLLRFTSIEALMNHVFAKKQRSQLMIQQGIKLMREDKRSIDFRVHTNKDINGDWKVSAIAAKVAGIGSPTTHIKAGGEVKTLEELFFDTEMRMEIKEMLEQTALELAQSIEEHVEGIVGEIGFDLGIDKENKIWLFEANSKPGRHIFAHPYMRDFELLTRKMSLSFAIYLTVKQFESPQTLFS